MEAVLVIGLLVTFFVMLSRTGDQAKRIERLDQELTFARQAYDGLAARLWHLEKAFGDALRTIEGLRRELAERKAASSAEGTAAQAPMPAETAAEGSKDSPAAAPTVEGAAQEGAIKAPPPGQGAIEWKPFAPEAAGSSPALAAEWKPVLTQPPKATPAPTAAGEAPPAKPPSAGKPAAPADEPPDEGVTIDWERWVGVRGAAALGALILVIAGLYFFKYSIDKGFITPSMRVVAGTLVGLICIGASEQMLRKSHVVLANWLGGAGIAILYIAFWAAKAVYGLVGTEVSFGLMIVVTAACVLLAVRHESMIIAILGLFGGFATPFALSSGSDHPIGLFGYLLLLDVALLFTGQRKRWPVLGLLSLGGTLVYQAAWISERMGPDRLWLGMGVVALFAAVFTVGGLWMTRAPGDASSSKESADSEGALSPTAVAGLLLPFGFGIYFSVRSDLGPNIYPLGVLLFALSAGAAATAIARRNMGVVLVGAASAVILSLAAWMLRHDASMAPWEAAIVISGLALVFHAALEVAEWRSGPASSQIAMAASVASLGSALLALLGGVAPLATSPAPWLVTLAVATTLTLRQGSFARREPVVIGAAVAVGVTLPAIHIAHEGETSFWKAPIYFGMIIGAAALFQVAAILRRAPETRRYGDHAAALCALLLLFEPIVFARASSPAVILFGSLALGFLALLSATRLRSGIWAFLTMPVVVLVHSAWTGLRRDDLLWDPSIARMGLIGMGAGVLLFAAWPRVASRSFRRDSWAWRAAALAGPLWFLALREAWLALYGPRFIGALPITLGFVAFFSAVLARGVGAPDSPRRRTAIAWTLGVALGFVTVAIPLQLDKEWITVGWALEGAALLALWKRLDHAGLKYVGLAHLVVVTIRLVLNPYVLEYHPVSHTIILNWLAYTYWLPAAGLLAAWALLRDLEVPRLRPSERLFYPKPAALTAPSALAPLAAMGSAAAAIIVLFVWLNLTILDAYSTGSSIEIVFEHQPARDLTLSIAWAAYALILLAIGMTRGSAALRWASLLLILATVGKVFLYDLAHLKDLYRVASLVGLALSLILISLAYQRFVFGASTKRKS